LGTNRLGAVAAALTGMAMALLLGLPARAAPHANVPRMDSVAACSWDRPGHNPFMGDVVAAIDRYIDIPTPVRMRLKERMRERRYDDMVEIRRDEIRGKRVYRPEIRDMHFGLDRVCRQITRDAWPETMKERGLVYCDSGHCILVPTVCRNVSRIQERPAAVSAAREGLSGDGVSDAEDGATAATRAGEGASGPRASADAPSSNAADAASPTASTPQGGVATSVPAGSDAPGGGNPWSGTPIFSSPGFGSAGLVPWLGGAGSTPRELGGGGGSSSPSGGVPSLPTWPGTTPWPPAPPPANGGPAEPMDPPPPADDPAPLKELEIPSGPLWPGGGSGGVGGGGSGSGPGGNGPGGNGPGGNDPGGNGPGASGPGGDPGDGDPGGGNGGGGGSGGGGNDPPPPDSPWPPAWVPPWPDPPIPPAPPADGDPPLHVPEPGSAWLFGLGLLLAAASARRRAQRRAVAPRWATQKRS
jgi:PEP-CTERM motif